MASIRGILNIQAREFNFLQRGKFHRCARLLPLSTCASRSRSRRQPLVARGGFPDSVRRHGTARPLRFMTDDLLATSMGLNPAHFQPHLKPLRLVSAEIKEKCCLVADEISRASRSRILAFMTTFPDIVAELDMRLVEIDFEELTSMCAKMFVSCAAPRLRNLASTPLEQRQVIDDSTITDLAVRYVLCTSLESVRDHHVAQLETLDHHELIVQLSRFPPSTRTGYRNWRAATCGSAAVVGGHFLQWLMVADDHRGPLHVTLESVVRWWSGRGHTIDRTAALLFLSYFSCEWCRSHTFINANLCKAHQPFPEACVSCDLIEMALVSRTALLELHTFLTQQVGNEPEQLQRELRRRFGMEWTMSVRYPLIFIFESSVGVHSRVHALCSHLAMRILQHLRLLFQAMVSGVMSDSLPTETKAILCRKWTAMMPLHSEDQKRFWGQLHLQMQSLVT